MKSISLHVIAIAASLLFSAGAMAQTLSAADYKVAKQQIAADKKTDGKACAILSGNPKDICQAEAKGREKLAVAELDARNKPTPKTHYAARIAKAEAVYGVSRERCDDLAGNAKDVCVKEAKSAQTAAKADAKLQLKTTAASTTAAKQTGAAQSSANDKIIDARKDASADKREAQYKVAEEKCDTYAGEAKTTCLEAAKVNFGKR